MTTINDILISYEQDGFLESLSELKAKILNAAYWPDGDARHASLTNIVNSVKSEGDAAVARFTKDYDSVDLSPDEFLVTPEEIKKAHCEIDDTLLASLRKSIDNVRKYQTEIFTGKSIAGKVKYTPIKRVGVCIPGASAPLPSTVIMTAVPAQVAGVKEIVLVSPPRYNDSIHPVILALCYELGITEVYRIGGAQAVAALAYGTDHIEKVNKIVGPGSTWLQMAKRHVFGVTVDIDSIAGPSEVLVIADKTANPAWVAADMLSQAEHAPGSAMVFTDSKELAGEVINELEKQVKQLDRAEDTEKCLVEFSGVAVFESMDTVIEWANAFAAEHLQIQCGENSNAIADRIENAGAIFIGQYTPVAVGDYWAGPSHTLPTGMSAKFFSALSSNDFVKSTSIIQYDKEKLTHDSQHIIRLAKTEGLDAHAKSVEIRCKP
jgi:histidinol dehydrogenase